MHLKKKYGKHYGRMPTTGNGQAHLLKAPVPKPTGKKEARFIFQMAKAPVWSQELKTPGRMSLCLQHLGMIKDGKEDIDSDEVKAWAGAMENYTLTDEDGNTKLVIDIDVSEDWLKYMEDAWPKALEKLKGIAEK